MDNNQFKNLIATVEFDIQVCVSGMIKSKKYYDDEVVGYGSYLAASYTHFCANENIEMGRDEEIKLINHICEFYDKLLRPNGITSADKEFMRNKYFQLLNEDTNIIKSHIEAIVEVAAQYTAL